MVGRERSATTAAGRLLRDLPDWDWYDISAPPALHEMRHCRIREWIGARLSISARAFAHEYRQGLGSKLGVDGDRATLDVKRV